MAEFLNRQGYQTAGFFSGPYLHPTFGFDQGFDVYRSCMTAIDDGAPGEDVENAAQSKESPAHEDITGPRTVREIQDWVSAGVSQPFFLFVHLWDVHYDYIPPRSYLDRFDPDYVGSFTGEGFPTNPSIQEGMPERDFQHLAARYDAEIRFTDDTLRAIVQTLEEVGLMEETLVIVTSDHGEEFFEHGGKGHQRTLFDEVIRIPLILYWPSGLSGQRVVDQQVRLIDLLPTIAEIVGAELPNETNGRDLGPLLRGESLEPEPALSELLVNGQSMRSWRSTDAKIVENSPGSIPVLYRLDRDPNERFPIPLDELDPEELTEAELQLIAEFWKLRSKPFLEQSSEEESVDMDPEVRKQLEALGYLQ